MATAFGSVFDIARCVDVHENFHDIQMGPEFVPLASGASCLSPTLNSKGIYAQQTTSPSQASQIVRSRRPPPVPMKNGYLNAGLLQMNKRRSM